MRRSPCRRPGTYTLREDGNGPVVTRGSAPSMLSVALGRGAESGMSGLHWRRPRRCARWKEGARPIAFLSLRRHDPDQVRRVSADQRRLSPSIRAPLGLTELSTGCRAPVKRAATTRAFPRRGDGAGMRPRVLGRFRPRCWPIVISRWNPLRLGAGLDFGEGLEAQLRGMIGDSRLVIGIHAAVIVLLPGVRTGDRCVGRHASVKGAP